MVAQAAVLVLEWGGVVSEELHYSQISPTGFRSLKNSTLGPTRNLFPDVNEDA